jgi:YVTN family beta-propeller protein
MDYRVLGPFEIADAGHTVALRGAGQRTVLAALLVHANETVSTSRLIDALWRERPPDTATKIVQVYVSQLRKLIGATALVTRRGGYALEVGDDELDARRFERLVEQARSSEPHAAAELLREALALWRGPAFADLEDAEVVCEEAARLDELRTNALADRIDADLALGQQFALVPELASLSREHPLHERFRAQQMLALYRSGRQAEALEVYQGGRRLLLDEVGLEPSPLLQRLEQAILRQDPELDLPPTVAAPPPPRRDGAGPGLHVAEPGVLRQRLSVGKRAVAAGILLLACAIAAAVFELTRGTRTATSVPPNSVGVIDPRTNQLTRDVPVGDTPSAVATGGGSVWVVNANEQTLSRIDARARTEARTIGSIVDPTGIAYGRGAVWVATASNTLLVVDPELNAVVKRIRLPATRGLLAGATLTESVAADDSSVWATSAGFVSRIDPRPPYRITDRIAVSNLQCCGAVGLGGGVVWTVDGYGISRIDPRTRAATHIRLPFSASSVAVAFNAVWLTNEGSNTLWQLDARIDQVAQTTHLPSPPSGVATGYGAVWVASTDGTVERIDHSDGHVTKAIRVGSTPRAIAAGEGAVWVAVD